jgi:hypothetical protein
MVATLGVLAATGGEPVPPAMEAPLGAAGELDHARSSGPPTGQL